MNRLSFDIPMVVQLAEHAADIVPGIRRAVCAHFDEGAQAYVVQHYDRALPTSGEYPSFSEMEVLQREGRMERPFGWLREDEVFVSSREKSNRQLTLADEQENTVLVLRFKNVYPGRRDLLILTFSQGAGISGLSGKMQPLTVNEKNIIGNLLHNTIRFFMTRQDIDREIYLSVNESFRQSVHHVRNLENELETLRKNHSSSILDFCDQYIENNSGLLQCNLILSGGARDKLVGYTGNAGRLEGILKKAVTIAINRPESGKGFEITEFDLVFPITGDENKAISTPIYDRFSSARKILDRYEQAAAKVTDMGLKINGINIGLHCQPPITPAAITDSLKKHQHKITALLEQHPDRWGKIRSGFKPLLNLMDRKNLIRKAI